MMVTTERGPIAPSTTQGHDLAEADDRHLRRIDDSIDISLAGSFANKIWRFI
jgi:hypothetical protein